MVLTTQVASRVVIGTIGSSRTSNLSGPEKVENYPKMKAIIHAFGAISEKNFKFELDVGSVSQDHKS